MHKCYYFLQMFVFIQKAFYSFVSLSFTHCSSYTSIKLQSFSSVELIINPLKILVICGAEKLQPYQLGSFLH